MGKEGKGGHKRPVNNAQDHTRAFRNQVNEKAEVQRT